MNKFMDAINYFEYQSFERCNAVWIKHNIHAINEKKLHFQNSHTKVVNNNYAFYYT